MALHLIVSLKIANDSEAVTSEINSFSRFVLAFCFLKCKCLYSRLCFFLIKLAAHAPKLPEKLTYVQLIYKLPSSLTVNCSVLSSEKIETCRSRYSQCEHESLLASWGSLWSSIWGGWQQHSITTQRKEPEGCNNTATSQIQLCRCLQTYAHLDPCKLRETHRTHIRPLSHMMDCVL